MMPGKGVPSREHVVAPVLEISPVGQASQGGVPVLLKELLAHRPFSWFQAQCDQQMQPMESKQYRRDRGRVMGQIPGTVYVATMSYLYQAIDPGQREVSNENMGVAYSLEDSNPHLQFH